MSETTGSAYDPWAHAETLGLQVDSRWLLPHGERGRFILAEQRIELRRGLTARAARCVLAHEIAHAMAGDGPTPFGPMRDRQETLANRRAALRLICPAEYAAAEATYGPSVAPLADELDVLPSVVVDFRQAMIAMRAPSLAR